MTFDVGYRQLMGKYVPHFLSLSLCLSGSRFSTIFHVIRKVCYQLFIARLLPAALDDLSAGRVPNVNYMRTHPEWNIDMRFIVFSGDTRARTRIRVDPRALCAPEETTRDEGVYES